MNKYDEKHYNGLMYLLGNRKDIIGQLNAIIITSQLLDYSVECKRKYAYILGGRIEDCYMLNINKNGEILRIDFTFRDKVLVSSCSCNNLEIQSCDEIQQHSWEETFEKIKESL